MDRKQQLRQLRRILVRALDAPALAWDQTGSAGEVVRGHRERLRRIIHRIDRRLFGAREAL